MGRGGARCCRAPTGAGGKLDDAEQYGVPEGSMLRGWPQRRQKEILVTEGLETLEEIREINAAFPFTPHARRWKEEGGKIVGWICNYVPEEIIHAAGAMPYRMTGDAHELELEEATAYLSVYSCSYTRSCLELALNKQYSFLDGIAASFMCDGTRRLADVLDIYGLIPLIYGFGVPRKYDAEAQRLYKIEVVRFRSEREKFLGVEISDDAIRRSIVLYNETRRLLQQLYDTRKADNPPISGAEVQEVMNACVRIPRESFNDLLKRLLAEISRSGRELRAEARLMIDGPILNNPEFIRGIEALNGLVVVDALCTGQRYWDGTVDTGPDPLTGLSEYYLNKFSCPRMFPPQKRLETEAKLIKDYRVDGVICQIIRYCNTHIWDYPLLKERVEELGVPVLQLDLEYGSAASGQIKTRAQAFIETIMERKGAA